MYLNSHLLKESQHPLVVKKDHHPLPKPCKVYNNGRSLLAYFRYQYNQSPPLQCISPINGYLDENRYPGLYGGQMLRFRVSNVVGTVDK